MEPGTEGMIEFRIERNGAVIEESVCSTYEAFQIISDEMKEHNNSATIIIGNPDDENEKVQYAIRICDILTMKFSR